jgi:hypothetical protein
MQTPEGRVDAFNFLWPSIQQISDKLERSAIARDIAQYLNVDREAVLENYRKLRGQRKVQSRPIGSGLAPNEKILLSCLLASPDARIAVRHYISRSETLPPLQIEEIFAAILAFDENERVFSLDTIATGLDERSQRILADIGFSDSGLAEENAAEQALHCLRALEVKSLSVESDKLRRQIKEMEAAGNLQEAMELMNRLNDLKKRPPSAVNPVVP